MLQNGLSRELFERWCTDAKNGCVIAGYCVEGTLARHILSEPEEIIALAGHRLPMRLQVLYISFSAHADYSETSSFVRKMRPAHLVRNVCLQLRFPIIRCVLTMFRSSSTVK